MTRKLKFSHIPKTAGSSIEECALGAGVQWGMYDQELKLYFEQSFVPFWHIPLRNIVKIKLRYLLMRYDFFAVVRNPYDRCLSEVHYFMGVGIIEKNYTKEYLNRIICSYIHSNPQVDHWAPQSNFIYDERGQRLIKHVLRFENLKTEFESLMKQYNLNIQLNKETQVSEKHFTIQDLTPETIRLINNFYNNDFVNFGYQKINV